MRKLFDHQAIDTDDSIDAKATNDQSKNMPDFLKNVEPVESKKRPEVRFTDINDQKPVSGRKIVKKKKKVKKKRIKKTTLMSETPKEKELSDMPFGDKQLGETMPLQKNMETGGANLFHIK